jgi:ribosome maturation factor RimP
MTKNGLLPVFYFFNEKNKLKQKNKHMKIKDAGDNKKNSFKLTKDSLSRAAEIAQALCESEGIEFVHIEYQREPGGRILRVYIDKPGGVRLDDCVNISRQLGDLLDIYFENELSYNLEVSSPGDKRPLGKLRDFDKFKGKKVKVKTIAPMDGQKNFTGTIIGIDKDAVNISLNNKTIAIPYEDIAKARLINNYGEN